MRIFKTHKRIFFLLMFVVLGLIVLSVVSSFYKDPEVVSIFPAAGTVNVPLDQKIVIVLKKNPTPSAIAVAASPNTPLDTNVSDNTLTASPPSGFSSNTVYTVSLKNTKTQKVFFQSSFRTIPPQGSPKIIEDAQNALKDYYPLAPFDPPEKSGFYFVYTDRLKITVYFLKKDTGLKKVFEDFAAGKGVDLTTHQITYISPQ